MKNRGPFIHTFSGLSFYPKDPSPDEICIFDIAHALANVCRFNGHIKGYGYSVAQHSVLVCDRVAAEWPAVALDALMHDASEAYLGDMTTPLKKLNPRYKAIEAAVMGVIRQKYGLLAKEPALVKLVDCRYCNTEARDLKNAPVWAVHGPCGCYPEKVKPWPGAVAEREFLKRWRRYAPKGVA